MAAQSDPSHCHLFDRAWVIVLYCIYPEYLDTSKPYHTCSKIRTNTIYYLLFCLKIAGWVANSVDPDVATFPSGSTLFAPVNMVFL